MSSLSHNVHMKRVEYLIGRNGRSLIGYIHEDYSAICETYSRRPAVLVFPGGGYNHLSPREEDPAMFPFFAAGYQVFVLRYSVGDDILSSSPESEAAEAIAVMRRDADRLNIESDKIAVMGFSAGGHLAASIAAHHQLYGEESRVDAAILSYPVITMGEYTHIGSRKNLLGARAGDINAQNAYSVEKQVTGDYPPAFIWQCREDNVVPFKNSLLMAEALKDHGVPYELMPVEGNVHGWGAAAGTPAEGWMERAVKFWKENGEKQ